MEERTVNPTAETAVKQKKTRRPRAWELDFLRGLSILLVAIDHIMFDIAYVFNYAWAESGKEGLIRAVDTAQSYWEWDVRLFFWPLFVFIFFFVSGICTTFSRSNLKRGLKLAAVALLLTLVTYLLETQGGMTGMTILFGVLHCLACCILIYAGVSALIRLAAKDKERWVRVGVFAAIGAGILIYYYTTFPSIVAIGPDTSIVSESWFTSILVYTRSFWYKTADYFPLVPFLGYFSLGVAVGALVYPQKKSLLPKLDGPWFYPFTLPGRYSLIVYLGSQVTGILVLALITYIHTGTLF